jgi:hypothetical protein
MVLLAALCQLDLRQLFRQRVPRGGGAGRVTRVIAKMLGVGSRTVDRDIAPNGAAAEKNVSNNNGGKDAGAPFGAISGAAASNGVIGGTPGMPPIPTLADQVGSKNRGLRLTAPPR